MYMIEPVGEHLEREGSLMQVIDPAAIASIVENFNAAAQDPNFSGMLIDHEHFKHDLQKETVAYGWLMGLQGRADGIYGQIRWSVTGQAAVDGGDYRFFSTEYDPADMEVLSGGEPRRARPLRLDGLTLTNAPNNKGARPITNRGGGESVAAATHEGACRAFGLIVNRKRATLKCAFDHAWHLASEEYPALFAATRNRQRRLAAAPAVERAPRRGPVVVNRIAGEMILNMVRTAQADQGGDFDQHWHRVCNRRPELLRIMNGAGDAGWEALAELEPVAREEYLKAKANPNVFRQQINDLRARMHAKYPGLNATDLWAKIVESDPKLASQYHTENNASAPGFAKAMSSVMVDFPELASQGRWDKVKELYPEIFWPFVLSLAPNAPLEK